MLKKSYVPFYLEGRDAKLMKDTTDDKALAAKVLAGEGDPRTMAQVAAVVAAKPFATGRSKTRWLKEHEAEIRNAGGDASDAYDHYMRGRIDSLAYSIEADILAELGDMGRAGGEPGTDGDREDDDDEDGDEDDE
jgi:hypothetical protein